MRERGRVNAGGESDRRKEIEAKPSTERGVGREREIEGAMAGHQRGEE